MNVGVMTELLRIAASVATPLGALGLLIAFGFFAYQRYLKYQENKLKSLNEDQRAQSVDSWLTRYKIDGANFTKDQKFTLICKEMDQRARTQWLYIIAGLIVFGIAVYAYLAAPPPPKAESPPDEFPVTTCQTADDSKLPDSIFGSPQDADGMPRQWLRLMDAGGLYKLKSSETEAKQFWLLTNEFAARHVGFTAYVYAGTTDKVVTSAFLVEVDPTVRFVALSRVPDSGHPGLYLFNLPESKKGSYLLVFLAMNESSFQNILPVSKFRIRSRPL